jgi:hypothetical protein
MGHLAAVIEPPLAGRVGVVATGTATAYFDLQAEVNGERLWCGRFVDLEAGGVECFFALTQDTSTTLDPAATGTASAPPAGGCRPLPVGDVRSFAVPSESSTWRYLAYRTASGAGTLRIAPSSRRELAR